jgi:hypothetical protein
VINKVKANDALKIQLTFIEYIKWECKKYTWKKEFKERVIIGESNIGLVTKLWNGLVSLLGIVN